MAESIQIESLQGLSLVTLPANAVQAARSYLAESFADISFRGFEDDGGYRFSGGAYAGDWLGGFAAIGHGGHDADHDCGDHASDPVVSEDILSANTDVWTPQQIADYLTGGYWTQRSWDTSGDRIITVDIADLNAGFQDIAREALATWTDATGLIFQEVTSGADITFDDEASGAYSSTSRSGSTITSSFINVSKTWGPAVYQLQTFIHEIGHSLGLGHAGPYNGSASYGTDNLYANDSWQATVMSYFDQNENTYIGQPRAWVLTPMLSDILAIRDLYGTSGTTRTGDSVYGYNTNVGGSFTGAILDDLGTNYTLTIIDDGGIDTIDLSQSVDNNRIDLTPGSGSDTGGLVGNIWLAPDTIIENAIGGSGNDTIIGNDADNRITGGNGNDVLEGGEGEDTAVFAGNLAEYTISTSGGVTTVVHAGGTDTLTGFEFLQFADQTIALGGGPVPPSVTAFGLDDSDLAIGADGVIDSATLTIVFSEAVTGFTAGDISGPGTITGLTTTDGITWTATFTPDAGIEIGTATLTIAGGSYVSVADGTAGSGGSSGSFSIDTITPGLTSVAIADADGVLTGAVTVTFTFSEAVAGFAAGDISGPGTITGLSTSDGIVWTATFTPNADVEASGLTLSVAAGSYSDAAGNLGAGGSWPSFAIDTRAPTQAVSIDGVALDSGDAVISLSLSGALGAGETLIVYRDGAAQGAATFDGANWRFVDANLPAGSYSYTARVVDAAGNQGPASAGYDYDLGGAFYGTTGADTITGTDADDVISGLPQSGGATGAGTIDILTGKGGADRFILGNGTAAYYDDGNDKAGNTGTNDYAVITDFGTGADVIELTNEGHQYHLVAYSQDGWSGTGVFLDTNNNGRFDNKDEMIALIADVGPADLEQQTSGNQTTITRSSLAQVSIGAISQDTGQNGDFITSDRTLSFSGTATAGALVTLSLDGAVIGTATAGAGGTWSFNHQGTSLADGTYALSVQATVGADTAAASASVVVDGAGPSVSSIAISDSDGTLTTGETAIVTLAFSEAVTGLSLGDLSVSNAAAGTLSGLSTSDGGQTWTVLFTPASGITATGVTVVVAGPYTDLAGNAGSGGTSDPFAIDTTAPGATDIYGTAGSDVLAGTAANETISGLPESGGGNGAGTVDVLTGGGGDDLFIFGDSRGVFYDDGNPRAGNTGKGDYGQITDFEDGDMIQLAGAFADYHLVSWTMSGVSGTAIIYDPNRDGYDSRDELIGHVAGVAPGALTVDDFTFV